MIRMRASYLVGALAAGVVLAGTGLYLARVPDDPGRTETKEKAIQQEKASQTQAKPQLELLIGRWVATEKNAPFTLVVLPSADEAQKKGKVEGHSVRRVWKGWYEDKADDPAALRLFYTPRAEEMNAEIPPWARKKIDGDLEWRLELLPLGEEFSGRLRARWYRGEVRWEEGSAGKVEIIGEGKPLEFELAYDPILHIEQGAITSLTIEPASPPEKGPVVPLSSVLQEQRFFVSAYLPKRVADAAGPQLTVTFHGTESRARQTLELKASTPGLFGAAVRYTHQFAVSLGACNQFSSPRYKPPVLSLRWFLDLEGDGSCLDFAGKSGEIVEVTHGKNAYRFQWFATWVQAAIARQRGEIEKQRTIFNAVLTTSAPAKAKEAAVVKLRMIQNYDALMRADFLHDLHRVAIGEIYLGGDMGPSAFRVARDINTSLPSSALGLLFYTDDAYRQLARSTARLNVGSSTMWADALAFHGGSDIGTAAAEGINKIENIVWTPTFTGEPARPRPQEEDRMTRRSDEAQLVYAAVRAVSSRALNEIAKSFFKGSTLALYDGLANSAPFLGNAVILTTGKDHFGRKVNNVEYWLAAVGFASEFVLTSASVYEWVSSSYSQVGPSTQRTYHTLTDGATSATPVRRLCNCVSNPVVHSVSSAPGGGVASVKGRSLPAGVPPSVPPARAGELAVRFEPPDLKIKLDPAAKAPENFRVKLVSEPVPQALVARETRLVREATADYGGNHSLPTPAPDAAFQPLTQAKADGAVVANYAIWRETGRAIEEGAGINALREYAVDAVRRGELAPAHAVSFGMLERYPDALLDRYLLDNQIEVATLAPVRNKAVTAMEVRSALETGWTVQAHLDFGAEGKRIVVVEHVVMDGQTPKRVQAFDPKYGVTIEMDALVFNRRLDRNLPHGNLKAVRATDPDLVKSRKMPPPSAAASRPVQPAPVISDVPTQGAVFRFTSGGETHHVKIDKFLGGGANAQAYSLVDHPQAALRSTKDPKLEAIIIDDFGRAALKDARVNKQVVRGVEQYGSWRTKERLIEIVEKAPEIWADMSARFKGEMTKGQALAVEAAARELNKAGYAWLDNHKHNFSFEPLPGNDRWRVVVFDPGGIVPTVGADLATRARNARELQGYNHNPARRFIEKVEDVKRSVPAQQLATAELQSYADIRGEIYPSMQSRIDFDQVGIAPDDLLFKPSIGVEQKKIRDLYTLDEKTFNQAYVAHYGRN